MRSRSTSRPSKIGDWAHGTSSKMGNQKAFLDVSENHEYVPGRVACIVQTLLSPLSACGHILVYEICWVLVIHALLH